jgi:hypothetical protein
MNTPRVISLNGILDNPDSGLMRHVYPTVFC